MSITKSWKVKKKKIEVMGIFKLSEITMLDLLREKQTTSNAFNGVKIAGNAKYNPLKIIFFSNY